MSWWPVVLVLAAVVYAMVTFAPWVALRFFEWRLRRSSEALLDQEPWFQKLAEAEHEQTLAWPAKPRPGRYQDSDRQAQESLAALGASLKRSESLWAELSAYRSARLAVGEVASGRAWRPLVRAATIWRNTRPWRRLLQRGDASAARLRELQQVAAEIPSQVRAQWATARAESNRLSAILEAEQEAGTQGLEGIGLRLRTAETEIERSLDALAQATPAQTPTVVAEADNSLQATLSAIEESERLLSAAAAARSGAEGLLTRVDSTLRLAEERWEGLKSRGATEPGIARDVAELRDATMRLAATTGERKVEAYQRATEEGTVLDGRVQALMAQLDALDELMRRSKEAIEGDVQALARAQDAVEGLTRQDPLLEPDQALGLIEQARGAYVEAERQRGLGTMRGYDASLPLSQAAVQSLAQAEEGAKALPGGVRQVRELLGVLTAEALGDWRTRAERVREQLIIYPRHWDKGLAGDSAEAISNLDQVEVDLERIPPNVRYLRRFRQSELAEAADILAHGQECMARAKQLIAALEGEQQRIEEQRAALEQGLDRLAQQQMPDLLGLSAQMLPELQQRVQGISASLDERRAALRDPAQVNYDEAMGEWLPSVLQRVEALRGEHEDSSNHYRAMLKETIARVDRAWGRLSKLDMHAKPGPEEDMDQLIADLNAWRAEAQRQTGNPLALREIAGPQGAALEERVETAHRQIAEGRRAVEALDRQYRRYSQSARSLRAAIQEMRQSSRWPKLGWDTREADRIWEQANDLERESHAAPTLSQEAAQLQRAATASQQADQLYAQTERLMSNALRRLDDETRSIYAVVERGERRATALRVEGNTDAYTALEERLVSARRAIETAQAATTLEDALRYLRDAREALG